MTAEPARILVVDDNATARYVISSWLRRDGYLVAEAATGAEALTRLQTEPLDVVVLDVGLPDTDGFAVCEQIKSEPATAALPVIHVSAIHVDGGDRAQGLTRGADAYLVEPVDPDELLATVQAVLRHYRARQRAERKAMLLARLVELTPVINSAARFASSLRAAADGTARIFEGPAVVTAVTPDGRAMTAEVSGPAGAAVIRSVAEGAGVERGEGSVDAAVRRAPNSGWPARTEGAPAAEVWSVTVRAKNEGPPVHIAVCSASFVDDDAPVLLQWGQAVAHALGEPRADEAPTLSGSGWALLTRREREIAMLVTEGHTNRKIATLLMIAKRTADAHVEHILAKLGFSSRAQIAAWVVGQHAAGVDPDRRHGA